MIIYPNEKDLYVKTNNKIMKTTRSKLLSILGKDACNEFNSEIEDYLKNHYKFGDNEEFTITKESLDKISKCNKKQLELLKSIGIENTKKEIWEKYPTWESLKVRKGYFIKGNSSIDQCINDQSLESNYYLNTVPSEKHAKSILAFCQLSQITAQWNGPDFNPKNPKVDKYQPYIHFNNPAWVVYSCDSWYTSSRLGFGLVFKSKELCDKSIELHNQLWKDYFMID